MTKVIASESNHFVAISEITADEKFHVRLKEDKPTLLKYTQMFLDYNEDRQENANAEYPFPPIAYMQIGEMKILVAGFHRYLAAKEAGCETISTS